jgi:alanyl-tRNA synthetase
MPLRLYHADSYLQECATVVTAVRGQGEVGLAVALAETVFYPASGGQPADRGYLDGLEVTDVWEADGEVWHHVALPGQSGAAATTPRPGDRVAARIDWTRRFDHMQQHTGQHILSQAFLQAMDAQTISVRMDRTCTLDLAVPSLDPQGAARAERLANTVVIEDRPVMVRQVDPGEAASMGLRRLPRHSGAIRVVEVAGFDLSACGGTHVRTSGEAGPIAVKGWERYKGGVRVEFLCGWRAMQDYRRCRELLRDLAGRMTTSEAEVPEAVARLRQRVHDLERDLADARGRLLELEADVLIGQASPPPSAVPVIAAAFTARPVEEVRALARALTTRRACVAVLAVEPEMRLVVARGPGVGLEAAEVVREALAAFGGRGGGRGEVAEGAAVSAPSADALVGAARTAALRRMGASVPERPGP